MIDIFRSPFVVVSRLPGSRVVLFKRLPETTPDVALRRSVLEKCVAALEALPRSELSVLIDVRSAPIRVDPEHEEMLARMRPRMFRGFSRMAVLIATSVGRLQVSRLSREEGLEYRVFDDEGAAMSYLTDLARAPR